MAHEEEHHTSPGQARTTEGEEKRREESALGGLEAASPRLTLALIGPISWFAITIYLISSHLSPIPKFITHLNRLTEFRL